MGSLGHVALGAACVAAVVGVGAAGGGRLGTARWCLAGTAASLWVAVIALADALVTEDFTLTYVVDHSRSSSSAPYRLAGLWGGREGSLLLWSAMVATAFAVVGPRAGRRALATGGIVAGWLAVTVLVLADPFEELAIPAISGSGLTPILEHPAMLYHPLLLYGGLVLTVVPFALAVDAASAGRPQPPVAAHRSGLLAFVVLTLGLVTGANWAYVELGWGGYWAWDPVENSALLPWLALLAMVHLRRAGAGGNLLSVAATAPFLLACLGAVTTRSGLADSVHAFADGRTVGWSMLGLTGMLVVVAAGAWWRSGPGRPPRSWHLASAGALLAVAAVVVVGAGTLYPVVRDLLGGDRLSVSGHYFARATWPLAVAALAGLALRRRGPLTLLGAAGGLVAVLGVGWLDPVTSLLLVGGGAAAGSAIGGFAGGPRTLRGAGSHVAHLGLALLLVGVAGSTRTATTAGPLPVGATAAVGGYELENLGISVEDGPREGTRKVVAEIAVRRGGEEVAVLRPELVAYPEQRTVLAEVALRSTPLDDVQIALRDADDTTAVIEAHVRPLAAWVWAGGSALAAGAALALAGSRRRDPAPTPTEPVPSRAA